MLLLLDYLRDDDDDDGSLLGDGAADFKALGLGLLDLVLSLSSGVDAE